MCISSFIGDDFGKRVPIPNDWFKPDTLPYPIVPPASPNDISEFNKKQAQITPTFQVNRVEFEALRKEVTDLKILLEKAKGYDTDHDEPNCEVEEKIALIKKFGTIFGIDFKGVFESNVFTDVTSTEFEPFLVVSEEKEISRFAEKELAEKFANYVVAYSGKPASVIEVFLPNLSELRHAVCYNGKILAAFVDALSAKAFYVEDFNFRVHMNQDTTSLRIVELLS